MHQLWCIHIRSMEWPAQPGDVREGDIYIDLDGEPVQVVRIVGKICCWIPLDKNWNDPNEREYTLVDHFLVRFRPVPHAA